MAFFNASNNCTFQGRFTRDPEAEEVGSGKNKFLKIRATIAVDKKLTKQQKEDYEDEDKPTADFIQLVFTGPVCDVIEEYFKQGSGIIVSGSLATYTWEDKDGEKQFGWNIDVVDFAFPMGNGGGNNNDDDEEDAPRKKSSKSRSGSSSSSKSRTKSSGSSRSKSRSRNEANSKNSSSSKKRSSSRAKDEDDDYEVDEPDYDDDDEDDDDLPF